MDNVLAPEADGLGTSIGLHSGFPNAAADQQSLTLSLDKLLNPRPNSTYFFRIRGQHWHHYGIFDNDIAVVDRGRAPTEGDFVIWWDSAGALCISRTKHDMPNQIWGVVTSVIHQYHPADYMA